MCSKIVSNLVCHLKTQTQNAPIFFYAHPHTHRQMPYIYMLRKHIRIVNLPNTNDTFISIALSQLVVYYRSQAFFFNFVRSVRERDFFGGDGDDK